MVEAGSPDATSLRFSLEGHEVERDGLNGTRWLECRGYGESKPGVLIVTVIVKSVTIGHFRI
jgi:hypothetical protein